MNGKPIEVETKEKIQHSVDSLERIYAVVVAFAVTKAIETVLFDSSTNTANYSKLIDHLPALIAFIVTVVPFYHGMHRHLNRTYIEERADSKKEGFLLLDFFVFFLESGILLVFASSLDSGEEAFIPLIVLLLGDSVWAFITHGIHYREWKNSPWKWIVINVVTVALLSAVLFSNIFDSGSLKIWVLAIIVLARTFVDYWWCWEFYFPKETDNK